MKILRMVVFRMHGGESDLVSLANVNVEVHKMNLRTKMFYIYSAGSSLSRGF